MKYLDEYRDPKLAQQLSRQIHKITTRPWVIMEVCGGQTHAIVKYGIDTVLPRSIELVHGPGCPVCVTPLEMIDRALAIASQKNVIFCSFGDMLRVPGSKLDLLSLKAHGSDVRILYSPLDAVKTAAENPDKEVVFFAVGFETTAPANAMAAYQAKQSGLKNFSLLVSHVLVPPAIESILSSKSNRVQGFLAAGHVCTVMGYTEYPPIAAKYKVPIIVTGFEPLDILQGIAMCVAQLEEGRFEVENQYARCVNQEGNRHAQDLISKVFCVIPRKWRGIGEIPQSGLGLTTEFKEYDAELKFNVDEVQTRESDQCISGLVLQGVKKPFECSAFGLKCRPEQPLGATMVSSEGACSAYFKYKREYLCTH
ncbi:MAG: hydrogenase formation protein HypD [Candidatus Omnitrophica bacterium]|nr:hydrogenase formation protein HypD [Candidatus Omnitrophota bacterium]MDE2222836.1 hydrogenase formation protein HypD [Candidatus Omnitrophota bacterium]